MAQATEALPPLKTLSLAILPSIPLAPVDHASLPPIMTSSAKRPKLSLDTTTPEATCFPSKHSTSLRLETLSATSPTIRNTFGNGYGSQQKPTLAKLTTTTTDFNPSKRRYVPTPKKLHADDEDDSSSSEASPVKAPGDKAPYRITINISSILRNGPLQRRRISQPHSRVARLAKKVVFRAPLTEEVKNVKYTMSHYDIEPPTPVSPAVKVEEQQNTEKKELDNQIRLQPTTYVQRIKKDSEPDSCPATPVAGRRKKDRHWVWTLGPTDRAMDENPSPGLRAVGAV